MAYKVNFIGRIGTDAEKVVTSNSSSSFISCRAAVDEVFNKEKITRWINLNFDSSRYKNLAQYLTKGKLVYITGSERVSGYKNKNGEISVDTKVWVDSIEFIPTNTIRQQNESQETTKDIDAHIFNVQKQTKNQNPSLEEISSAATGDISDDNDLPF